MVLEAARARFAKDGFAATTIRAIAADAKVDVSQVMQFFRSKNELFVELLHDRVYARYTEMTQEGLHDRPPTLKETGERLAAIVRGADTSRLDLTQKKFIPPVRDLKIVSCQ